MILSHGSYVDVLSPDVKRGRDAVDFGQGFYLTRFREQALDLFYATETYRQLTDPSFGLHLMSDEYILEDLRNNLRTMDFSH